LVDDDAVKFSRTGGDLDGDHGALVVMASAARVLESDRRPGVPVSGEHIHHL
jgi:hypothetical protein